MNLPTLSCRARQLTLRAAVGGVVLSLVAACGADSGSANGDQSKEVALFLPSSNNSYPAEMISTARDALIEAGYEPTIFENDFDQTVQDQQVQQYLASGATPAGIVWLPADNQAGIASVRRLAELGAPLVQVNQTPLPESLDYISAYAGVDDYSIGKVTGETAREWIESQQADGEFVDEPVNQLVLTYPQGFTAGVDRMSGFLDGSEGADISIIDEIDVGFSAESSYDAVSQALPRFDLDEIDVVYGVSEFLATGGIMALADRGIEAGQDVTVFNGNCMTDLDELVDGSVYATTVQSPAIEARAFVEVLTRLIDNGGVTAGADTVEHLPADPDVMPTIDETPAFTTIVPTPPLVGGGSPEENQAIVDASSLWGSSAADLCDY